MKTRLLLPLVVLTASATAAERDATQIVKAAVDHWRGLSSYTEMTMVIHRPDWERSMTMQAWTKGDDRSLVRVIEPKKDRGNGTLTDDNKMWTYSPKINRVIKVPSSMMGQSWMGSDFSNKDIARADDIIDQYDHTTRCRRSSTTSRVSSFSRSSPFRTRMRRWSGVKEVLTYSRRPRRPRHTLSTTRTANS